MRLEYLRLSSREACTFIYHKGPFCCILRTPVAHDGYNGWIVQSMTEPRPNHAKSDTSPEVRRVLYDLYRRMSPARKFQLIFDTYEMGRQLALAGLRMRHPDASKKELWQLWAQQHLGRELFEKVYGMSAREREA
jgi:hypothetical protein